MNDILAAVVISGLLLVSMVLVLGFQLLKEELTIQAIRKSKPSRDEEYVEEINAL